MSDFKFTTQDGMCPTCIVDDTQYYIQDVLTYRSGVYTYDFMSKPRRKQKVIRFSKSEELYKYIKDNNLDSYNLLNCKIFIDVNSRRRKWWLDGLTLREYIYPNIICGDFDTYNECLNYAKKWLEKNTAKQEMLF